MNYFEDHIGDYAAATAHLSWDEDMAYTRLIRAYYHTEKPIPKEKAYKLARADTPNRKKAVDSVLEEFFTEKEGHYHQKRCDEEIARYQDKQNKAKSSAKARWDKKPTHSGGNANASPDAMRTHSDGNAHQTPDSRHQLKTGAAATHLPTGTPEPEKPSAAESGKPEHPPQTQTGDPITVRAIELATMLRKRGAALTGTDPNVRKWAAAGVTDAQALTALETAQQRRAEACSPQPINSGYLDTIISDPNAKQEPAKKTRSQPWWTSNDLMLAKAKEIGIKPPKPGESWEQFRGRINAKLAEVEKWET